MARAVSGQRMFVAVAPSASAIEHLDEFLEPRRQAADFRWSTAEQFHVTLAFLESVEEYRIDALLEELEVAAKRRRTFAARIAGGGAFPDASRARVVYAGLDLGAAAATEIDRLAVGCRTAVTRTGIDVDGQRFRPHITLARLGRPADVTDWVRLLDTYAGPDWVADRVSLVASYLGEGPRGRPRYETLAELPLPTT